MGLTVSDSGGGDFSPVPEGTHIARCVRVIDLGMQPGSPQYPDPKPKVMFTWELPGEMVTINGEDRPAQISSRYTASLHEKASLRSDLESWRGRRFTADELKGFQLKHVLGVPCMITVVHSQDGKYANVNSIGKMPKGIECPPQITPSVFYEIEDGTNAVYHALSDKMRATIDIGAGRASAPAHAPQQQHDDTQRRNGQLKATVAAGEQLRRTGAAYDPKQNPGYEDDVGF